MYVRGVLLLTCQDVKTIIESQFSNAAWVAAFSEKHNAWGCFSFVEDEGDDD